ncbi:peptidogalycan biosysnthesis protein [Bradyrhizobium retamae]|uniref:BioF2-like acetyltransferase domain-containing protein n=1 Tax=Bradyrhizobium retamae TaxID=1300035 RepID=A0A0R3NBY7_9BRAD|nr:peptidogalycan biosysnthesis protein [Bradyrhizobium retamae]KRR29858.1 hypothetical protein CQ13_38185 [Bradyrhizobium retamae]
MKFFPFRSDASHAFCSGVSQKLSDMDEHEWDALVSDDNFYNSYRWLRGLEHSLGATDVLSVHGSAGLVAACTLWEGDQSPGMFFLQDCMAGVRGPWQEGFLWLGGRRNTHNEIPCIQGRRRHQALAELGRCALEYAQQRGYAGFVMPYMPYQAAVEFADAIGGAVVLHSAQASLEVPDTGLAGMMASWRAHDRNQTKSEIAAFRRMGSRVEWGVPDELDDSVAADLITQNRSRYGGMQDREWVQGILAGQRKSGVSYFGAAAVSKRDEDMTALAIFYRFGATLHLRYFGANYSLDLNDYRYFVLCYYEPLNYAAANGLTKLRLSTSALRAKVNRGAKIEPQALVVKCADEQQICHSEAKRHNHRMLREYQDKFPGHLSRDWELVGSQQNPTN